ncbi:hypothetical protein A176_007221 [Myxococcus hansupus]|uniref:Lipoprotein n=1 Tax=Pseudomyxococcus hansupus TaxID=1297742 RepID=A0A0H4X4Z3_9BACT|nr:hypothetical protein [Myxococcus hansupus]AKQ70309.1 hypothetical protein A176_007221 [Myxococcus hansupus]
MSRLTPLLPLCLSLLACAMEPDDPVFLSGTALEADGTPWRGGPLLLTRPLPLPTSPTSSPRMRFETWAEVTPDADGLFLHRLTARDTGADDIRRPIPWADDNAFQLLLPPRADGGRDFYAFELHRDSDVPPLRQWSSNVRSVEATGGVRLAWDAMPSIVDVPEPHYFVEARGPTGRAWLIRTAQQEEPWLGPELLEDFTDGHAHVQAFSAGARVWVHTSLYFFAVHDAPPFRLPVEGRVPISRGVDCRGGTRIVSPCPFTDGRLEAVNVPGPPQALATELTLVLPQPARPRQVVIRGASVVGPPGQVFHVEGSVDGSDWRLLAKSAVLPDPTSGPYLDETNSDSGGQEYYVRLELPVNVPEVREVRVWFGVPTPGGGPPGFKQSIRTLREVSLFTAP